MKIEDKMEIMAEIASAIKATDLPWESEHRDVVDAISKAITKRIQEIKDNFAYAV